jgi:hypothetical protein
VSLGGFIAAQYTLQSLEPGRGIGPMDKMPVPQKLLLSGAAGLRQEIPPQALINMMLPDSLATAKASLSGSFYDQSLVNDELARDRFTERLSANDDYWLVTCLS